LRKPTHSTVETQFKNKTTDAYVNSTAVSRTNAQLDKHSKDSKKVNLVPKNQPESSEKQLGDRKGLRASITVVKTGSHPLTLTALAENDVFTKIIQKLRKDLLMLQVKIARNFGVFAQILKKILVLHILIFLLLGYFELFCYFAKF